MAAFVTVPQIVMAFIGPVVGKIADRYGRKPILVFGFLFLPLRAILFALSENPKWLASLQVLDGLSAGIFGIVGVLMIADCKKVRATTIWHWGRWGRRWGLGLR